MRNFGCLSRRHPVVLALRPLLLMLFVSLALTGYSSAQGGTPKAPAASASAAGISTVAAAAKTGRPLTKIIQALPSRDFGFLPQILALSKGFFAEEGLDVQLPVMVSRAAVPALITKEIQFAVAGSSMRSAYRGAPLKAIFYTYNYSTLIAVGAPSVKSYMDLKGKALAIASPGSSEDFATRRILEHEGIPVSEVKIIGVGQGPQRVQAMLAGQVQFSTLNANLAVPLKNRGYNILGHLRELMPIPFSGFAVHQDTLKENPEMVKAWLRANIRALRYLKTNKADAAAIAVKEFNLDPAEAEEAIELVLPAISDDDPGGFTLEALIENTKQDLQLLKMPGDPLTIGKNVHDVTLLREVQRELGIRCTKGYQCQ